MQKIQTLLTITGITLVSAWMLLAPLPLHAQQIMENLCSGAQLKVDAQCNPSTDEEAVVRINTLLADIINIFSLVVGFVAVIMVIIGGLKYITSGGDSSNVTGAKNTILYAVVGLVVVALSQFIVRFVLSRLTG